MQIKNGRLVGGGFDRAFPDPAPNQGFRAEVTAAAYRALQGHDYCPSCGDKVVSYPGNRKSPCRGVRRIARGCRRRSVMRPQYEQYSRHTGQPIACANGSDADPCYRRPEFTLRTVAGQWLGTVCGHCAAELIDAGKARRSAENAFRIEML